MSVLKLEITLNLMSSQNLVTSFFNAIVILLALSVSSDSLSQSIPTPSPEQLQMLNSLPASEREALLEQFGITSSSFSEQQRLEFPELVRQVEESETENEIDDGAEKRIAAEDFLVVRFSESPDQETQDDLEDMPLLLGLLGSNTYELDRLGRLTLPGISEIALSGLTEKEAELRLNAEPALVGLVASVSILPLDAVGVSALPFFGYDLFEGVPTTFAPATDVPVPSDYVVGPGDQLRIDYFGTENGSQALVVNRDGSINLDQIGPVSISGLKFSAARKEIETRVAEQRIGVRASVTIGELRSIRVFVLGDVARPGSFTVSGLSTMTNALFVSGGVAPSGTLRSIQLKRNGKIVGTLDLYDLLLRGDTRGDLRLQPGDVIFAPPVGPRVSITGEVERPAIYELRNQTNARDLVGLAGGAKASANLAGGHVERIDTDGDRVVLDVDLSSKDTKALRLQDGDLLHVMPVSMRPDLSITLRGYVLQPGVSQWRDGLRLTDVISSPTLLRSHADLGYVLIRREVDDSGNVEALSADLGAALASPRSAANPVLRPRDVIHVFETGVSRGAPVRDLLEELKTQAMGKPAHQVEVNGLVRSAGSYPLEAGMHVSDLIRAGGGFAESAYLEDAELTRYILNEDGSRRTEIERIRLRDILAGDEIADVLLEPYDFLSIREIPEWRSRQFVTLEGEFKFPGVYPVKRGEGLSSLIQRAGGLTSLAFPEGSVFTRELLKQREAEQIEVLVSRLEADLAAYSLQAIAADADAQQAFAVGQGLLAQLKESKATGRLVIDLSAVLSRESGFGADITLKDGDRLIVPQVTQEVTVIGEVQYSTSHIFQASLATDDYIAKSGGATTKADEKRIYVVRANGEVVAGSSSRWLRRVGGTDIRPGDTIVVPLDADRIAPLTLWSSVTQIIYNLAVAVAAVNSF